MGQRFWLGSVLLQAGRVADALSFAQVWLHLPRHVDWPPRGGCTFETPNKTPLPASFAEDKSLKYAPCSILYTAALASYKLWGDCEIARQYLSVASKANPHILVRILAKVEQPSMCFDFASSVIYYRHLIVNLLLTESLNNLPRSPNGPEEAHDYLWLTQNLWMASDVWEWANNDAGAKVHILKTCAREGCNTREVRAAEFKRCGGCKEVVYCGAACQKEDWQAHKKSMYLAHDLPAAIGDAIHSLLSSRLQGAPETQGVHEGNDGRPTHAAFGRRRQSHCCFVGLHAERDCHYLPLDALLDLVLRTELSRWFPVHRRSARFTPRTSVEFGPRKKRSGCSPIPGQQLILKIFGVRSVPRL